MCSTEFVEILIEIGFHWQKGKGSLEKPGTQDYQSYSLKATEPSLPPWSITGVINMHNQI